MYLIQRGLGDAVGRAPLYPFNLYDNADVDGDTKSREVRFVCETGSALGLGPPLNIVIFS